MNSANLTKSNTDTKGLPLRLDCGGIRREDKPYDRPKWKLIYVPGEGATFVRPETEVKTTQPSDFFI